jgi:starch synthase
MNKKGATNLKTAKAKIKPLKILFVAAEVAPYASVGGLGQVIYFLSRELRKQGHDVRVLMPKYGYINETKYRTKMVWPGLAVPSGGSQQPLICNVKLHHPAKPDAPVYFLENMEYYEKRANVYGYIDDPVRWALLTRGALEFLRYSEWVPDVINCADWHTGHLPNYLRTLYKNDPKLAKIATVFSIHNLYHQGTFDHRFVSDLDFDDGKSPIEPFFSERLSSQNFMRRGIMYADIVNTVSENYAREILTPDYGEKLDQLLREVRTKLYGVLNGLDYSEFNPSSDKNIYANYSMTSLDDRVKNKLALQREFNLPVDEKAIILGMVGRLDEQKGIELLISNFESIIREYNLQFISVGGGDARYRAFFQDMQQKYPQNVGVHLLPNFTLPRHVFAGSDIFLIPSKYEPFGITAIEAMRYGAVPLVRKTGGLADTVKDFDPESNIGNGFTFSNYDQLSLYGAIVRAIETRKNKKVWQGIMKQAMQADFSWKASANKYVELYEKASDLAKRRVVAKVSPSYQAVT